MITYSKNQKSSMHKTYIQEYAHFKKQLYNETYDEMFNYIEKYLM
jgi:hypothetical protein